LAFVDDDERMNPQDVPPQELLTTQQAAQILGCSRQHVADLCDSGKLPCIRIGVHRRIRRTDLDGFMRKRGLRREELRSLWLHRAVAGKVVRDPVGAIARARRNIERFRQIQPRARAWLDEWERILDAGPDTVLDILTSASREAVELRQNTPFVGILSEDERRAVLTAFSESHRAARPTTA
jgi:excisionase family DNA binding protein